MGDREALLLAICKDPADDTVRLAYADWLQENPGYATCPDCEDESGYRVYCRTCESSGRAGRVPDLSAERAEFIRVQVECANELHCVNCGGKGYMGYGSYTATCKHCRPRYLELRAREYQLWQKHFPTQADWGLPNDMGMTHAWQVTPRGMTEAREPVAILRRGFVDEVRLPSAVFHGDPCSACNGRGQHRYPNFIDGTPNYSDSLDCAACKGRGKTDGIARALFSTHPITKIVLSDLRPARIGSGWGWSGYGVPPHGVPMWLFKIMYPDRSFIHDTPEAAADGLSAACVEYGRKLAGLEGDT